jgi:hypothetical protein
MELVSCVPWVMLISDAREAVCMDGLSYPAEQAAIFGIQAGDRFDVIMTRAYRDLTT